MTNESTELTLFRAGDRLGSYEIVSVHSIGEFDVYYCASHFLDGRSVVIKSTRMRHALESHNETRARLEAAALRAARNDNIVNLVETIDGPNQCHLVLDSFDGKPLNDWINQFPANNSQKSLAEIKQVLEQVLRGLVHMHAAGVYHRNLRPDCIIVGKLGRTKITDFSLVKFTPGERDPIALAEIYAFGAITLYVFTRKRLPEALEDGGLERLQPQWRHFIERCIAFRPDDRYPDAHVVLDRFLQLPTKPEKGSWFGAWGRSK